MIVILISADAEWKAILPLFPNDRIFDSPYGEWFELSTYPANNWKKNPEIIFFQGGWGKINAAASTQYAIDRWHPELLINLGTCGGFEGLIERNEIVLVDRTVVYDIYEQMGDFEEHLEYYQTVLDLSWLGGQLPYPVSRETMVSGDRDLFPDQIPYLINKYQAKVGDWESGAIAFVASRNKTRLIILRGVTDLVGFDEGEAYGNEGIFHENAKQIMAMLIQQLPNWIDLYNSKNTS